jgi:hypothetical protein
MNAFLIAFSLFDLLLGYAALRRALKLHTPEGRAWWASQRLYAVARFAAWTLPAMCIAAVAFAWSLSAQAPHLAVAMVLAPVAWLLVMGVFFAVVDIAEDGVLDFGRGPKKR